MEINRFIKEIENLISNHPVTAITGSKHCWEMILDRGIARSKESTILELYS